MNKTIHILITLLVVFAYSTSFCFGQKKQKKAKPNPDIILADKHFNNFEYFAAAEKYEKALKINPANPYAIYQLAECYRSYRNYKDAEFYYQKIVSSYKTLYPLARFWYATTLRDNGKFKVAIEQFEKFRKETPNASLSVELYREKGSQEIKGCLLSMDPTNKPIGSISLTHLPYPVNSPESDYAPVIQKNDSSLAFTSSRKGVKGRQKNKSFGGLASDIIRVEKDDKNWVEITKKTEENNFSKLNTKFNECSGSFTGNSKRYYFTRCNELIKSNNYEEYNCAIYVTEIKNNEWTVPKRLNKNINPLGQWNSQPSVSEDGRILFFVSKRPGGLGMHDIWYSTSNGDNNWGPATNLGDNINTLFSDVSPRYYAEEKVLFFSSNGRGGYGGLDIYMTKEDQLFDTIYNLGKPINTNRDDFYFVLGENKGYITSNREGGKGSDDIYSFEVQNKDLLIRTLENPSILELEITPLLTEVNTELIEKEIHITTIPHENVIDKKSFTIKGIIKEAQGDLPALGGNVYLVNEFGTTLQKSEIAFDGTYSIEQPASKMDYNVVFKIITDPKESYSTSAFTITYVSNTHYSNTEKSLIAFIKKQEESTAKSISIEGSIEEEGTELPAKHITILLTDTTETLLKTTKTDDGGHFRFSNLASNQSYRVILQQSKLITNNEVRRFSASEVSVIASESPESRHHFDNIYFDFDSYEVRPEGIKILEDLIVYCKGDSSIQIELFANTDSLGSYSYNKFLATQRGAKAMEYLVSKGVKESSIQLNAIGGNNFIARNDTKIGRQLNRRVEFYILGATSISSKTMTYIVEPNKSIESLAIEFDMTVEELIELNGLKDNQLISYTPIRVKKNPELDDIIAPSSQTVYFSTAAQKQSSFEEYLITKNKEINKKFNFTNPEYLSYLDSIVVAEQLESTPEIIKNSYVINFDAKPGNNYEKIAALFSIPLDALLELNEDPELLIKGEQGVKIDLSLRSENYKGYLVKEGETSTSIASRFGLDEESFIQLNKLNWYSLTPGMILLLEEGE